MKKTIFLLLFIFGFSISSILPISLRCESVKYEGIPFNIAANPAVDCRLINAQAFFSKFFKGSFEYLL